MQGRLQKAIHHTRLLFYRNMASSKLSLSGIVLVSASEDGIWTLIADYNISSIYDMHSLVLVSKSFYKTYKSKRGQLYKIVGRHFISLLIQFFTPLCSRGIKEIHLLDSFFKFLNNFQYEDFPFLYIWRLCFGYFPRG